MLHKASIQRGYEYKRMANMAGSVAAAAAAVAVMLQQDRHSNVDSTLMSVRELAPCEQKASRQISEQEHDQRVLKKKSRGKLLCCWL